MFKVVKTKILKKTTFSHLRQICDVTVHRQGLYPRSNSKQGIFCGGITTAFYFGCILIR